MVIESKKPVTGQLDKTHYCEYLLPSALADGFKFRRRSIALQQNDKLV